MSFPTSVSDSPSPTPATAFASAIDQQRLREALKRCSPQTLHAAQHFHATGHVHHALVVVTGIIERFVERDLRSKLKGPPNEVRLVEDLSVDSLTMMEIVLLAEEVLQITIENEEMRDLRTLADVHRFVESRLRQA